MSVSSIRASLIDISHARGSAQIPARLALHIHTGVWISAIAALLVFHFWAEDGISLVGYMASQIAVALFGGWIHNQNILWSSIGQAFGSALILLAAGAVGVTLTQAAVLVGLCFFAASLVAAVVPKG